MRVVDRLEEMIEEAFGRGSALSLDPALAPNCGWYARAWNAKGAVLLEAHGSNRTLAVIALKKRIERRGEGKTLGEEEVDP